MAKRDKYQAHFEDDEFYIFLTSYITKRYKSWRKKFLNVTGVDVARKQIGGESTTTYAIAFHVVTKTDLVNVDETIPKYFSVLYNGKRRKVPTDVIPTGETRLNYLSPGRNVFQYTNPGTRGTIGLIVRKDGRPHILSNMHVIGWSYLVKTRSITDKPFDSHRPPDITSRVNDETRPAAYFRSGYVDSRIDAAIAFIPPPFEQFINPRTDIIRIDNPIVFPSAPVTRPIPVRMLGMVSGFQETNVVSATAVKTFNYPLGSQTFFDLIALRPRCSKNGDSGSPVYEPISRRIIGIILGHDEEPGFSYVIPYHFIQAKFQLD